MKKYIKNATAVADKVKVDTPYNSYDFDTEEEAQEFLDYVNADPDYADEATCDLSAISCSESDDDDAYWKALGQIYWEEFGDDE